MSLVLLPRGGRCHSLSILVHRLGHVLVGEDWTTEGNFGTREICGPRKIGFTLKYLWPWNIMMTIVFIIIIINIMRAILFNVSNLSLWDLWYSQSHLEWHFRMLFQNSKLKARTSLLPRFSEKSRSSYELWALKELSKTSPHLGLAVYTFDHSDWSIRRVCTKNLYIFALVTGKWLYTLQRKSSWTNLD